MARAIVPLLARLAFWSALAFAYVCALLPGDPHIVSYDKANHGIAFATLALLARIGWPRVRAWRIAFALIAFGGLIELSQALPLIHRDASWGDLLADTIATLGGLVLGTAALAMLKRLALS